MAAARNDINRSSGFTLTELLVAVVVLLVVIIAVGRIFGTASQVVKSGEANAAILQESASLETLLRKDLRSINGDGFLLINCTAIRNDIYADQGGQLLDPRRRAGEWLRCDQVMFLTSTGAVSRQGSGFTEFEEEADGSYTGDFGPVPQSSLNRVYYGHGVQFPYLPAGEPRLARYYESNSNVDLVTPWFRPAANNAQTRFARWPDLANTAGTFNGLQPDATSWTLARQELLVADDRADRFGGNGPYENTDERYHLGTGGQRVNSAATRFEWDFHGLLGPDAWSSRVDVVAADLPSIQTSLLTDSDCDYCAPNSVALGNLLRRYWPRAEKRPLALDQSDAMTTMSTLAGNCSGFKVDWVWADGTGSETETSPVLRGVRYNGGYLPGTNTIDLPRSTPWFGISDPPYDSSADPTDESEPVFNPARGNPGVSYNLPIGGSGSSGDLYSDQPTVLANIENFTQPNEYIKQYTAVFGFNTNEPFIRDSTGGVARDFNNNPMYRTDYTPWPSALRISMVLHDPDATVEGGRQVQFTVPLPERVLDLPEE